MGSPLTETYRRLSKLAFHAGRFHTVDPTGDRWLRVDQLVPGGVDMLYADGADSCGDARDHLTAHVAAVLAGAVVAATWTPLLCERRLPILDAAATHLHRADAGPGLDRIAVTSARLVVLPDDRAARRSDVDVVAGVEDLHERFVDQLVTLLPPWFDAIRRRGPFGRSGMWGQVADLVTSDALWTAHSARTDQQAAWDAAEQVVALLRSRVARLRSAPRPFPVDCSSGARLFHVRGTCCLWYRTQPDAGPGGDGYCLTCPRRSDGDRHAGFVAHLRRSAAL